MESSSKNWNVECKPTGTHGYFFYREGSEEIPFYWEYGGGAVVVIVRFDESGKFDIRYPWAIDRKMEILERVA
jgi:hypothetical protein